MLFLIDGYNVTRADDVTHALHPDDQRDALMRRLEVRGRELLGSGRIVVVWDKGHLAEATGVAGVEAVFSGDRSADDVIVAMAEAARGPVTLVTADRELQARVREHAGRSVEVLPVRTLFESARPKRRTVARHRPHGELPDGHAGITREMEGIWLPEEER